MQNNQDKKAQKVVLITGAARRVGAETARLLHASGMNIVVHYHTSQREANEICSELNQLRAQSAVALRADLLETLSLSTLVSRAAAVWGRLDVLVNNASRFYQTPIDKATEFQWDELLGSNAKAPYFLAQAAAPYLSKHAGCIINIADIHADKPMRDYSIYCISKAAIVMLTKALAKELGPNIRVNAVAPGPILWPEGDNALSQEMKALLIDRTALQSNGSPEEVAKAVLFFIAQADFITGQILTVDGGRSLFM